MNEQETRVGRIYDLVRKMAEDFEFKPESQINEVALAQRFQTSRTPVREALNRLVAEGFLTFQARKGFFCRPLSPSEIGALYEARCAIETEAVRLAIRKATPQELDASVQKLRRIEPEYGACRDPARLLELDEIFHLEIAHLSRNPELARILENLNGRIRFVRLVDLKHMPRTHEDGDKARRISAHKDILDLIAGREEDAAVEAMRQHIERRREETTEAVAKAFAAIYCADDFS